MFNLCAADMSSITPESNCIQYTYTIQLYTETAKIDQKRTCIKVLEKDFTSVVKWPIETNLAFSIGKTKFILMLSNQLSVRHEIKDEHLQICCNNTELERVTMETTWFKYR